jgi:hypothetical protein
MVIAMVIASLGPCAVRNTRVGLQSSKQAGEHNDRGDGILKRARVHEFADTLQNARGLSQGTMNACRNSGHAGTAASRW